MITNIQLSPFQKSEKSPKEIRHAIELAIHCIADYANPNRYFELVTKESIICINGKTGSLGRTIKAKLKSYLTTEFNISSDIIFKFILTPIISYNGQLNQLIIMPQKLFNFLNKLFTKKIPKAYGRYLTKLSSLVQSDIPAYLQEEFSNSPHGLLPAKYTFNKGDCEKLQKELEALDAQYFTNQTKTLTSSVSFPSIPNPFFRQPQYYQTAVPQSAFNTQTSPLSLVHNHQFFLQNIPNINSTGSSTKSELEELSRLKNIFLDYGKKFSHANFFKDVEISLKKQPNTAGSRYHPYGNATSTASRFNEWLKQQI